MKGDNMTENVEPKKTQAQVFADEYAKLCEKMGYRIVVTPVWIARDDGTFSMQLQYAIGELPKPKKDE